MMDIGVYTVYPMVALFGRPLEVEAQGIVLSSGADGQGAVNFRYEGMNATVLYSKTANSSLPSEIQGEGGNLLLDAIHTIRDVAYLLRPAAASGRGDAPGRHSVGLPLEKDTYYYEVAEKLIIAECIVAKNRHGETGKVELRWMPEYTTFSTLDTRYDEED